MARKIVTHIVTGCYLFPKGFQIRSQGVGPLAMEACGYPLHSVMISNFRNDWLDVAGVALSLFAIC